VSHSVNLSMLAESTFMRLRLVGACLQITTRDESGALCVQGTKQTTFGTMAAEGPPTTLSDTGVDRVAFLQGNLARDATYFLNGTPVGARDLFQARPTERAFNPACQSHGTTQSACPLGHIESRVHIIFQRADEGGKHRKTYISSGVRLRSSPLPVRSHGCTMPPHVGYGLTRARAEEEHCKATRHVGAQVEQGLGLGSGSPLFNRHVVSLTRFIKLRSPPPASSSPPPVLVTHAR